MSIYVELLLLAVIVVYIVDLSGFTDSWRSLLAKALHVKALKPLPPFDCGQCMTWWSGLIFAAATGKLTLPVVAYCALLSFLSITIGSLLVFIQEALSQLINHAADAITGRKG